MNSELVEELANNIDSIDVGKDAVGTSGSLQAEQVVVLNEVVPVLEALLYAAEESVAIAEIVEVIVQIRLNKVGVGRILFPPNLLRGLRLPCLIATCRLVARSM